MNYLLTLDFTEEEVQNLLNKLSPADKEKLELFPNVVTTDYNILKEVGVKNYKEIFMEHTHMFFLDPNRLRAIFDKYDQADLVRCLEKNGAVIEKL